VPAFSEHRSYPALRLWRLATGRALAGHRFVCRCDSSTGSGLFFARLMDAMPTNRIAHRTGLDWRNPRSGRVGLENGRYPRPDHPSVPLGFELMRGGYLEAGQRHGPAGPARSIAVTPATPT
jgi:hypothetical protein